MSILFVLIPLTLVLVVFGLWAFFWAVGNGQFDDLETPAWEVLIEEPGSDREQHSLAAAPRHGDRQEEKSPSATEAQH